MPWFLNSVYALWYWSKTDHLTHASVLTLTECLIVLMNAECVLLHFAFCIVKIYLSKSSAVITDSEVRPYCSIRSAVYLFGVEFSIRCWIFMNKSWIILQLFPFNPCRVLYLPTLKLWVIELFWFTFFRLATTGQKCCLYWKNTRWYTSPIRILDWRTMGSQVLYKS